VTALATRYRGRIRYYELWNEPDAPNFWHGTVAQLVRMCRDAAAVIRRIDTTARLLSPSFHGPSATSWFVNQYLASGGGGTFDIVNFHGRAPRDNGNPDNFLTSYAQAASALRAAGLDTLPFWDDEAGPLEGDVTNADNTAAYVSRAFIVRASVGMGRFYYAQWDAKAPYGLVGSIAATAYAVTAGWLTGAIVGPCTNAGTLWTCAVSRPNGFSAELAWDASQSCNGGTCTTVPMPVDTRYVRVLDLSGGARPVDAHIVNVGIKPVLVQNR
jgi:hypothetical protein